MNSASSSATYIKMQDKILRDSQATCMLVEVIARRSENIVWEPIVLVNGRREKYSNEHIRRVSADKFYATVFNDTEAFFKLCKALPMILDDVMAADASFALDYAVCNELDRSDFFKSLYLLAFSTYEGFDKF